MHLNRPIYWVLDEDGVPRPVRDPKEWAEVFSKKNRYMQQTRFCGCMISTVFLGIDHSFKPDGPPILFETMVFNGPLDGQQERYATLEQAQLGHARWVAQVRHKTNWWTYTKWFITHWRDWAMENVPAYRDWQIRRAAKAVRAMRRTTAKKG